MSGIVLLIGCEGHRDYDFTFCPGVENQIYLLTENDMYFKEIMNFFDKCKLFDQPLREFTSVQNFLGTFKTKFVSPIKPTWNEHKLKNYQTFAINHRKCSIYLRLSQAAAEMSKPEKTVIEKPSLVAIEAQVPVKVFPKLKLVKT